MHFDEISDEEWLLLAPILADPPVAHRQRGRPRAQVRIVANAVLRVLTTGESWSRLPSHYPSAPTCRHRFEAWRSSGALAQIVRILSNAGRTFRCGSQFIPQRRDASSRETWQSPHVADTFRLIAQRLPNAVNAVNAEDPVLMPEQRDRCVCLLNAPRRKPR